MEGLRTWTKKRLKRFAIPLVDSQLMRNEHHSLVIYLEKSIPFGKK